MTLTSVSAISRLSTVYNPVSEAMMAKSAKDPSNNPARNKQDSAQKIVKSGEPGDGTLSDDDLKKVTGGPIYMGTHGAGGGGAG